MAVLINFKICDNDKACSGMSACPNNVFSWDEENKTLLIDNSKCVSCGLCEKACMVSAIRVAKNQEEYNKIQKEFDEDKRTINDLLVERYGGKPIDPAMIGKEKEIVLKLNEAKRPLIVELFNEDSIMCLLKSIPMKKIANLFDENTRYRKVEVTSNEILEQYGIKELPALLFFKEGNFLGKFEGYVDENDENMLVGEIKRILNK